MKSKCITSAICLVVLASAAAHAALTPLASFGVNGWLAPTLPYLTTGSTERGLDYNPTTGNLILISRVGATGTYKILNGTTGGDNGNLNQGGGIITGGTFRENMVGVAADGAIYMGNLSTSTTSNFKVYRWANEGAVPTVAYDALTTLTRTGDSFAVIGSGTGTVLAAAGTNNVSASNFATFSTGDGSTYASTAYTSVAGTTSTSNDYRLGLTFIDTDTLIGNQGAAARITDFGVGATLVDSIPLGAAQRPLDYAVIGGIPVLAVIDSNSSNVEVFNISTPSAPISLGVGNNTTGALTANGNGAGSVAWGPISGNTATLYAMSTNQGIQAFNFVVPEPTTTSLLALSVICGLGLRRRAR